MTTPKKVLAGNNKELENKLKEAVENTDTTFDLTNCNLKILPANTFELCKSLDKQVLCLKQNQLSSFGKGNAVVDLSNIKILDLSHNKFTKLPSGLEDLPKLEVLKVANNKLKELPKKIGNLTSLIHLDVSNNNFKNIPLSLGNCANLRVLNLKDNRRLTKLPVTLGKLKSLMELEVDPTITYPPAGVLSKGTSSTILFLAQELEANEEQTSKKNEADSGQKNLEDKKQLEILAIEQEIQSNILKEVDLQNQLRKNKSQLLATIRNEQDYLAKALAKVQEQKDVDRETLIKLCQEEEKLSNEMIAQILKNNKHVQSKILASYNSQMQEDLEKVVKETANLNNKDKKQILESMDETMKMEIKKAQEARAEKGAILMKSVMLELTHQGEALDDVFKKYEKSQKELTEGLKNNELLQKAAVASLIERNDATSWALKQQIMLVEEKLIELTRLELSKKKLESNQLTSELNQSRCALTRVLMDLFVQQEARRQVLVDTLRKLETERSQHQGGQSYWMEQYKNILNSKSAEMVKYLETVDPLLKAKFFENGVLPYLPTLKDYASNEEQLKKLDNKTLSELGVDSEEHRKNIISAVAAYFMTKKSQKIVPSAPPEVPEPSAPPGASQKSQHFNYVVPEECVICLDAKPNVIFIPCGHVCSCSKCFISIATCPICRVPIDIVEKITEA